MERCHRVSHTDASEEGQLLNQGFRHVRTKAEPVQPIPKFTEVLELMLEQGNEHIKLNVSRP